MALREAQVRVEEALRAYEACVEREAMEYGEEYERVTYMEYEAPAPDPCAEAFSRLLAAVRAYEAAGGRREELDLRGKEEKVYEALDKG
ncbi:MULTISPECIES: hypothetical protein [Thermus]|jgi:hypothetical protein|uniref:Uncharacterized protein n=1 Tax=Thermus brockianus TaxID=56956 RepID=A0A1J0LTP6_THEBO|nr:MULTISPECIES: hypothetical protein [Thermus]APD09482.1 hypothetical protein A0O31_01357 [Thermus brockianus]BDG17235.1 hypothetical protein TbrSNM41_19690 [Thermus brockianus]